MSAHDTRIHVFLGKGGVGKTTCAAATALALSERGEDTLAISTDPTPSLSHIFELEERQVERLVMTHLFITELGLEEVRAMWDERFGREVFAVFSTFVDIDYETFVAFVTGVLPGLNEEFMVDHIRRAALEDQYAHIVWDTAPLGQTLALLGMPSLLAEHLRVAPRIYSHLRTSGERRESVMAVLARWSDLARECMEFLRNRVSFTMVTIPEALAVRQLDGAVAELRTYGLTVDRLVVNNVVREPDSAFLRQKAEDQAAQLELLHRRDPDTPVAEIPLFPHQIRGVERLREIARFLTEPQELPGP